MQENNEIKHLKLEDIIPNRLQPRTEFDEEKLNELATSIKQYGVINPIIVRNVGNKYEIIAGERRYKASKMAGLTQIPAIISNMDDTTSAEIAVIENIQRQDLSSLEEARSYRKLLDQCNITQEQLAKKMGKTQSTIANKMRLLNLCDEVQEALENNQISERHARSLLQLKNINDQREMLEKIISENMTVKTTENAIKEKIQTKNLNSNKEILENTLISSNTLNENIYGNDVVSIMDLNKKELEKESDNMNNNEQNIQMNQGIMSNMDAPIIQNNRPTPAFGDRFFPSLEDQETNLNLSNPFEATLNSISNISQVQNSQPMMENLVETPLVSTPVQQPQPEQIQSPIPEVSSNIPSFVTNNQTVPVMSTPIPEPISTPEINLPPMFDTQIKTPESVIENIPQNDFVQVPPTPINIAPTEMEVPFTNNNFVVEPIINPIANQNVEMPVNIPTPEVTVQPTFSTPIPEQFTSPVQEAPINIPQQPEVIAPIIDNPVELPKINESIVIPPLAPDMNYNLSETSTMPPVIPEQSEVNPISEYKTTDNIINAINAIKNLGLSIGSIGYKVTLLEEDTPNSYKITIEIEK